MEKTVENNIFKIYHDDHKLKNVILNCTNSTQIVSVNGIKIAQLNHTVDITQHDLRRISYKIRIATNRHFSSNIFGSVHDRGNGIITLTSGESPGMQVNDARVACDGITKP
jgi:hypothetical protein